MRRTRTTTYSRPDLRRHARRRLRRMHPSQTHSTWIRPSSRTRQSVRVRPRRNGPQSRHQPRLQISHPPRPTRRPETGPTRKRARAPAGGRPAARQPRRNELRPTSASHHNRSRSRAIPRQAAAGSTCLTLQDDTWLARPAGGGQALGSEDVPPNVSLRLNLSSVTLGYVQKRSASATTRKPKTIYAQGNFATPAGIGHRRKRLAAGRPCRENT